VAAVWGLLGLKNDCTVNNNKDNNNNKDINKKDNNNNNINKDLTAVLDDFRSDTRFGIGISEVGTDFRILISEMTIFRFRFRFRWFRI
jgi:hypothetical protein